MKRTGMNRDGNTEMEQFYASMLAELKTEQTEREEGGSLEQLFTEWASGLLAEKGEVEDNPQIAYEERFTGTRKQHKINAYFISENNLTLELYITLFKGTDKPVRVGKEEIETACKRITNFFRKGIYNEDYAGGIEDASEIFDLVSTLAHSKELRGNLERVNMIILTDGIYNGDKPADSQIFDYPLYYRVVDLEYLFNISEKSHTPIRVDFKSEGIRIPCVASPSGNEKYQSYLAIIPGEVLAGLYERYGSRLLEQNVRSFLQFTGKINKGIRKTILEEPEMFLAFNNGLAVTAGELLLEPSERGEPVISEITDLQIVNGGQTTASLYHTLKKDKADLSRVFVQAKISVINNREHFADIVARISECANTQNKVSISDLSSNNPWHIQLEKLSRSLVVSSGQGKEQQTCWFYERARGQYKNARQREGFTRSRQKMFDLKYPVSQRFTKEEVAKYVNVWKEVFDGRKLVIGPHVVVRGGQKNYQQFMRYNLSEQPDNVYFEDLVARMIVFRTAEKIYGVKPHAIGDMRYITVPYAIAYLGYQTDYRLDLYKIWKNRGLSEDLKSFLYTLMVEVEKFIRQNAPGALYGEWAKKEECWEALKNTVLDVDFGQIGQEFADPEKYAQRHRVTEEQLQRQKTEEEMASVYSVPPLVWKEIGEWGEQTGLLSTAQLDDAFKFRQKVKKKSALSEIERRHGMEMIGIVAEKAPEILFRMDELAETPEKGKEEEITPALVEKIVAWDKKNRVLLDYEYRFMQTLATGQKEWNEKNIAIARLNLNKVRKRGFKE